MRCRVALTTIQDKLSSPTQDHIKWYQLDGSLLTYPTDGFDSPRVVVPPDDDLRARLVHEYRYAPVGGHLGREKTFAALSRDFYWPRMYTWIQKWVRSCKTCRRVKPAPSSQKNPAPAFHRHGCVAIRQYGLHLQLTPGRPGPHGCLGSRRPIQQMVHLVPVVVQVTAEDTARLFLDLVFRYHGLQEYIVSDRDPRFTWAFWNHPFELVDTRLQMSTTTHPETYGQTERANRLLRTRPAQLRNVLPVLERLPAACRITINNAAHASTGLTPVFVNNARHPHVPAVLAFRSPHNSTGSMLGGGGGGI
ncbi:hypothetical protein PC123_g24984 [Phytophthora cactorum]|nr:hypothetical protein PC123_g24984 [Phytophthora cactorum]